jgi:hypothetical protein
MQSSEGQKTRGECEKKCAWQAMEHKVVKSCIPESLGMPNDAVEKVQERADAVYVGKDTTPRD